MGLTPPEAGGKAWAWPETDKLGKMDNEGEKKKKGMKARLSGKRPNETGGRDTEEKKKRDEREYGLCQRAGPTRGGWEVGT